MRPNRDRLRRRLKGRVGMAFFPLFIDLSGREVLAVGAGRVGSRRIETLSQMGALVTVVSLQASETVRRLAEEGTVRLLECSYEEFREKSLPFSCFLVLAATGDAGTDSQAAQDGRNMNAFVNVAGRKEASDFYFPGLIKSGDITAGIIADGRDHGLAKRTTERVARFLQEEALRQEQDYDTKTD